ncbi:hypothetical protein MBLNU13_g08116t2 [Cladosporium sp. NU13]
MSPIQTQFQHVSCDNVDHALGPIRYDLEVEAVVADASTRVNLDLSSPPAKGTILACRELYNEMNVMYVAAYRAYWLNNRFVHDAARLEPMPVLPANKDLQHMEQEESWDSWLLPAGDRIFGFKDFGVWSLNQGALKDAVSEYMASLVTTWNSLDPRAGRGLTREMRHIHHIARKGKRLCESLALHYTFQESWTLAVELTDDGHTGGRMLSLGDLQESWQFAELDELSTFPACLQAAYRAGTKMQLDPSIGHGFTFNELVIFLEALEYVFDSFDDLPRYCSIASL